MKPKSLKEFMSEDAKRNILNESLVNKAYAIAQNSQHNSTRQKISSLRSNARSLISRLKSEEDLEQKINILADVFEQFVFVLDLMSDLSSNVKNIAIADVILSDDLTKTIQKQFDRERTRR